MDNNTHTTYIKELSHTDQVSWDSMVTHPVQSYAWVESRKALGIPYTLLGVFTDGTLVSVLLVILQPIFGSTFKKAQVFKGALYTDDVYQALYQYGRENNIAWYSFEPDVIESATPPIPSILYKKDVQDFALWTPYINLDQPYTMIENNFSKVVRNESRHAVNHGMYTKEGTDQSLFDDFISLMFQTKERKQFSGYTKEYYKAVFTSLKFHQQVSIFITYTQEGNPVAGALVFDFKDTLYYAYAGSLGRETPKGAMYLLVISIIQYGQAQGKKTLDLFGSLDPSYVGNHPWKGFSQFKKSFNGIYKKYIGRYDLVVSPLYYRLYYMYVWLKSHVAFFKNLCTLK